MLPAQICDLLLVLAHGDAAVKAALARPGTLRALCAAAARLPAPAQLKCLKCLKHLSGDPGMLEPMQAGAPARSAGREGVLGVVECLCGVCIVPDLVPAWGSGLLVFRVAPGGPASLAKGRCAGMLVIAGALTGL